MVHIYLEFRYDFIMDEKNKIRYCLWLPLKLIRPNKYTVRIVKFGTFHLEAHKEDLIKWRLYPDGIFIVHFYYKWLEFGVLFILNLIWFESSNYHLKFKIFLWLVKKTKILWQGQGECPFCGNFETINHLFVT